MNKTLVIFDLDGTLYKADSVWVEAIQKGFRDFGFAVPDSQTIISCFGESPLRFLARLAPKAAPGVIARLASGTGDYGMSLIAERGRLYEGVMEMLEGLRALGFPLVLCTNGSMEYGESILSSLGVRDLFGQVASADGLASKDAVIARLARDYPLAVVVGDRDYDFLAARANRLASIGAAWGFGGDEVKLATYVAETPHEILTHILRTEIFLRVESRIHLPGKRLVGINGVDLSGKTIFAQDLERYLVSRGYKTALIHLDDFHNPREIRHRGKDPVQGYLDNAFNLELLEKEILSPLSEQGSLDKELALLDLDTDDFTCRKRFKIAPDAIVILEGVLLYREPLEGYFDVRVFLDIPFSEVLVRARKRDVPRFGKEFLERYRSKYIPLEKRYLEEHKPKERSDLVIDNTDFTRPVIRS